MNPLLLPALLLPFALASEITAETASAPALAPADLQAQIAAAVERDRGLWSDFDLDRDRRPSQVEVIICLARRPAWLRERFPQAFAAIDADHDRAISFAELSAFAGRAPAGAFTFARHERSIRERSNLGAAGAAGSGGASIGVDSGSGTHAYAFFGQQQAYIADYDVVNGQYDPVIGVLGTGVVLDAADARITITRKRRRN